MLDAKGISFQINQSCLLQPVSLDFTQGLFHVVMGANGAGKSTLLRLLAGELQPSSGKIYLNGKDLGHYTKMELATKRAVLSQHYNVAFPISVNDIVQMGRYPHFKSSPLQQDQVVCKQAMERMNVYDLRERDYNTLSGGEAQKVQMSRVLSQIWEAKPGDEKWLFLDEPVSHLDIKYQHQLLNTAKSLCKQHTTVIAVLHDINLAVAYADRILFMKQGRVVHDLVQPNELSPAIIKEIFDVDSTIIHPENHAPVVVF